MKNYLLKIQILALIFIGFTSLKAAHLVGGEITYTCQGNNLYEIKLRIYRDCGSGGAQFDANASIAIYNSAGTLIQALSVAKGPTIPISTNPSNDPCITVPPGLCTEYAEYITSITLPPIAGGYVISHQRCCRNNSITNITNSGDWGNTYTTEIPPMDTACNNSPQINNIAPTVICIGSNLNLTLQANDADGDSLHFEFCDILHGGGKAGGNGCGAIIPNPSCPPPFTQIPFAPPFTAQNPMPGSPQISIDPVTGFITGKPNAIGQYVVGICVTDYKNGVKQSTVRIDYQFNVANCGQPIASIETPLQNPSMLCNGLTVSFKSLSSGASSQEWIFGDPVQGTSTDVNPTFTFSSPGVYPVTLIINPGQSCTDSITYFFTISNNVDVDLVYTGIPCFEVQGLEFSPVGTYPANATFLWNFGPLANISSTQLQFPPPITWSQPGTFPISLTINWNNCTKTFTENVEISNLSLSVSAGPDQEVAPNEVVYLNASGGVSYRWGATKPVSFSDPLNPNASSIPQYDSTFYYVFVKDQFGCTGVDTMLVYYFIPESEKVMNVITPNGDGKNDVLDLGNVLDGDNCRFFVYDRWGREVYQQDIYDNTWNGVTSGGQDLQDGTYYFIVQHNNNIRFKGPVTIMKNK